MDDKDLKIQGLLEKIGSLSSNYENEIVNLRVTLTNLSKENDDLKNQIKEFTKDDQEE